MAVDLEPKQPGTLESHRLLDQQWRHDPTAAEAIICACLPDRNELTALMRQLSQSVAIARETTPNGWSTTLFGDGFKLNVGPVEVLIARNDSLTVVLSELPPAISNRYNSRLSLSPHKRIPGSNFVWRGTARQWSGCDADLAPYHEQYIKKAGTRRDGQPVAGRMFAGHSPGLLTFMTACLAGSDCTEPALVDQSEVNTQTLFDPLTLEDARRRILASIVSRQGQAHFRRMLLDAYAGRCAITGCDAEAALEAAHITPYLGEAANSVTNGLLLRSDIHTLFDLHLLTVDPLHLTVRVGCQLAATVYAALSGLHIAIPGDANNRPSIAALELHSHKFDELSAD